MKIHDNTALILGPPGTGKTTKLIDIIKHEINRGVNPEEIAFVSFTRKAAYGAKERVIEEFDFHSDRFPWFKTLHSLAYSCLGISQEDVFNYSHAVEFGKKIGEFIAVKKNAQSEIVDAIAGMSDGSLMMFIDNLSRMRMEPVDKTWRDVSDDKIGWIKMDWFCRSYKNYKESIGLLDFTDMIHEWIERGYKPKVKVVIIDEAQDLSRLQWEMIKKLVDGVDRVYIAGDDDQSIYEWSGADVKFFIDLDVRFQIVLDYSYRLPETIWQLSNDISSKIKNRKNKDWTHREAKGSVNYVNDIERIPMHEGNWLILTRNRCFFDPIVEYCRMMGFSYDSPVSSPLRNDALQAVKHWERLRKGETIYRDQAIRIYSYMRSGVGYKRGFGNLPGSHEDEIINLSALKGKYGLLTEGIWHEVLEKIPIENREFYISILRKGESVKEPRINIRTIHSEKGGQEDNVVILPDMTARTAKGAEEDPDSERRVFYVGVTRAKNNLYILEPEAEYYFPIGDLKWV